VKKPFLALNGVIAVGFLVFRVSILGEGDWYQSKKKGKQGKDTKKDTTLLGHEAPDQLSSMKELFKKYVAGQRLCQCKER
jgi:hypothetical protein